jgi:hypothetical protein
MSLPKIEVKIRPTNRPGVTKAHADVRLLFPNGDLDLIGFAVIKENGKSPWVGFPQTAGRSKFFPVVEASGEIRKGIVQEILNAYEESDANEE